jgi:hypothetical protein
MKNKTSMTVRIKELMLNINVVNKLRQDQLKMRHTYMLQGELNIVANIDAHLKRSEEQLERYTSEYQAIISA